MRLSSILPACILKIFSNGDSTVPPVEVVQVIVSTVKKNKKIKKSYVRMKPLPVKLVPIGPCLPHMAPCEERASMSFVSALLSTGIL